VPCEFRAGHGPDRPGGVLCNPTSPVLAWMPPIAACMLCTGGEPGAYFERLPTDGCHREQPATARCEVGLTGCGLHLAPGRSAWCLAQSNTNSGHGIPSRPLAASKHCLALGRQSATRSKLPTLDSGKPRFRIAQYRQSLPDGVIARLVGVELRRHRRRIGGLHGMRYPLHSSLNPGVEEILTSPTGFRD